MSKLVKIKIPTVWDRISSTTVKIPIRTIDKYPVIPVDKPPVVPIDISPPQPVFGKIPSSTVDLLVDTLNKAPTGLKLTMKSLILTYKRSLVRLTRATILPTDVASQITLMDPFITLLVKYIIILWSHKSPGDTSVTPIYESAADIFDFILISLEETATLPLTPRSIIDAFEHSVARLTEGVIQKPTIESPTDVIDKATALLAGSIKKSSLVNTCQPPDELVKGLIPSWIINLPPNAIDQSPALSEGGTVPSSIIESPIKAIESSVPLASSDVDLIGPRTKKHRTKEYILLLALAQLSGWAANKISCELERIFGIQISGREIHTVHQDWSEGRNFCVGQGQKEVMRKIINDYSIEDVVKEARPLYKKEKLFDFPFSKTWNPHSECPEVFLPGYDNNFRVQATAMIIEDECWGVLTELEYQLIISSPVKSLMPLINRTLAEWCDEVSELIEDEPNECEALCEEKYTSIIFAYTKVFNQYYEKQYGVMEDCNKSFSDGKTMYIRSLGYGAGVLLRYMMMDRLQATYILRKEVAKKIGFILIDRDDVELEKHQWCGICHKELKESGQATVKMVICCNQPIESACLRIKLLANLEGNAKENVPKTCPVCQYALPKTFITKLSQEHKKELAVSRKRKPVYLDHNHARDKVKGPEEFQKICKVRLDLFRTLSARLEAEILRSQNLKLEGARESVPFQHFLCPCDPLHYDNLSQELESTEGHEHFLFMQSMLFVIRTLKRYQLREPPLSGCSRSYFKNLDALKPAAPLPSAPIPLPTAWVPPPKSWIPVLIPRAFTQYPEQPFVSSVTQVDRFGALGPSPLPWTPTPPPMTWVPPPTTSVRTPIPPIPSNHHGHYTSLCSPADA